MAMVQLGDGIEGLGLLAPGSVDLVLSDLPSGETRAPFDKKPDLPASARVAALERAAAFREVLKLLREGPEGARG